MIDSFTFRCRRAVVVVAATALVSSSLVFTPWGQAHADVQGQEEVSSTQFSDSDIALIDGLLFGTGPLANEFGTSIEAVLSEAEAERVRNYTVDARERLIATEPDRVREALGGLRSGSVNSVEKGLAGLHTAFERYITTTYSPEELNQAAEERASVSIVPMCGAVAVCIAAIAVAAYAAAAVHNAVALTAAAAVVVSVALLCGAWVGCGRGAQSPADERIVKEKFLANVTRVAARADG